jgi:hypothetical protein
LSVLKPEGQGKQPAGEHPSILLVAGRQASLHFLAEFGPPDLRHKPVSRRSLYIFPSGTRVDVVGVGLYRDSRIKEVAQEVFWIFESEHVLQHGRVLRQTNPMNRLARAAALYRESH